jgi:hypothetical protein
MTVARSVADGETAAVMRGRLDVEATAIGAQAPAPGLVSITPFDRLIVCAVASLQPRRRQRPFVKPGPSARRAGGRGGLFDLSTRSPLDLLEPKDL